MLMIGAMELNTMMNHDLKHALKYKDLEYRCFTHVESLLTFYFLLSQRNKENDLYSKDQKLGTILNA